MRMPVVIIATIILLTTIAFAQEKSGTMGFGVRTCGDFADLYRKTGEVAEMSYFFWAQGYISGVNMGRLASGSDNYKDLNSISVEEQKKYLRKYCDEHPLAQYSAAVVHLYGEVAIEKYNPITPNQK